GRHAEERAAPPLRGNPPRQRGNVLSRGERPGESPSRPVEQDSGVQVRDRPHRSRRLGTGALEAGRVHFASFSFTAERTCVLNAVALILSPSNRSIARRALPSRLLLKSPAGSASEAPLAKVIFTLSLYVSPVQRRP